MSINCLRQIFKMQIKKTFVSLLPNTFSHSSFIANPPFHTSTSPLPLLSKSTRVFNSPSRCHLLSYLSLPSQPLYTSLVGFIPVFFLFYPVRVCQHLQAFHTLSSWPACADLWHWRPRPLLWVISHCIIQWHHFCLKTIQQLAFGSSPHGAS